LTADTQENPVSLSLPVVETEKIITRYLTDSGFEVVQKSPGSGQVKIFALKGNENWQILLKPHSPLSCDLLAAYTLNGKADESKLNELLSYIDNYSKSSGYSLEERMDLPAGLPAAVLSQMPLVACIETMKKNDLTQFTGFVIDTDGLIISTAHDLEDDEEFKVTFNDGKELKGHLIKIDYFRDLSLIKVNSKFKSSVSMWNERNLLKFGEKVYSVTCPIHDKETIHTGIIDKPIGFVNNLPLFQVEMKIFPGSSGSPVFDAQGKLLGVVKGRYRGTNSNGFIIPRETVIDFFTKK